MFLKVEKNEKEDFDNEGWSCLVSNVGSDDESRFDVVFLCWVIRMLVDSDVGIVVSMVIFL